MQLKKLSDIDLHDLVSHHPETRLTLYLRTKDPNYTTRLKSLLDEGERLFKTGGHPSAIANIIEPLRRVWLPTEPEMNLVIFATSERVMYLPTLIDFEDLVVVSDSFHLKPLFHKIQNEDSFHVLRIGRLGAHLFLGNDSRLKGNKEIRLSRKEPGASIKANETKRFLKECEKMVYGEISNSSRPLFLMGHFQLTDAYRALNRYRYLSSEVLPDIQGHETLSELHRRIWPSVSKVLEVREQLTVQEFGRFKAAGKALEDVTSIARATSQGRIRTLFVSSKHRLWGLFDRIQGNVTLRTKQMDTKDEDILDDLCEDVLSKRGKVFVLKPEQMPTRSPVAAMLRW